MRAKRNGLSLLFLRSTDVPRFWRLSMKSRNSPTAQGTWAKDCGGCYAKQGQAVMLRGSIVKGIALVYLCCVLCAVAQYML